MTIEIQKYRPINKGVVVCGFSVHIVAWDLTINDCCLMTKGNKTWITFPSRKYETNGETKYMPYVYFGKEVNEKISTAIKSALETHIATLEEPAHTSNINMDDIPF